MLRGFFTGRKDLHNGGGTGLGDGTHGFLNDVGESPLLVSGSGIGTAVHAAHLQIIVIPLHLFHQAFSHFFVDAAVGDELDAVTYLGDFREHNGAAAGNDQVRRIACGGVGRNAGKGIRSAALHSHQKIGQGKLFSLSFVQDLQLLLGHLNDGIYHCVIAPVLLQHNDILGGIELWPPLAETVHREFLAAQPHQHENTAEIGMGGDIAQDPLGDLCFGGINGHAAAVRVVDGNDIVHIRIFGQDLLLDPADGHVDNTGHTLDRGVDGKNIPGASGASVRIPVAVPEKLGSGRQICADIGGKFHGIQVGSRGHDQVGLVNPAAAGDIPVCGSKNHAVADDLASLRQVL